MRTHRSLHCVLTGLAGSLAVACSDPIEGSTAGASASGESSGVGSEHESGPGDGSGSEGGDETDTDDTGTPSGPPTGCDGPGPALVPLFATSTPVTPIVTVRPDGVIVTRGAGRVRGRHELEGTYNPFVERYFENRSYGFTIEDYVATGEDRIVVTYEPEAPVSTYGSTTNLRVWKIYGDGNVFHNNTSMEGDDLLRLTKTLTGNYRTGRPMQVGETMEFEFGIFIAGNNADDPGAIEGRTSYYTDTFRYRVGEGGLHPHNEDPSGRLGPEQGNVLTGNTSVPYVQAMDEVSWSYSQMALNMQPEHVQSFLEGRRLFHTDFSNGEHSEPGNPPLADQAGKLGPLHNVARCSDCHEHNGRGFRAAASEPLHEIAIKLYDVDALGDQLQPQEAEIVVDRYETSTVTLADGELVELARPIYAGADPAWAYSPRIARQLPGLGLLEAIDEAQILARATEGCSDGISGRAVIVADPEDGTPRLGRFGWKAEKVSLRHQVADALLQDLGVTTTVLSDDGTVELAAEDLDRLVAYMSLLGLPGRRDANDPVVQRGESVFGSLGCAGCHIVDAKTGDTHPLVELREQTIHPYTDLLLHDMGPGLADPQGGPLAQEWRTAPLWGVGLLDDVHGELHLLHDGRARSVLEAILWHGGEAAFASEGVRTLPTEDRLALLAFLESL